MMRALMRPDMIGFLLKAVSAVCSSLRPCTHQGPSSNNFYLLVLPKIMFEYD